MSFHKETYNLKIFLTNLSSKKEERFPDTENNDTQYVPVKTLLFIFTPLPFIISFSVILFVLLSKPSFTYVHNTFHCSVET